MTSFNLNYPFEGHVCKYSHLGHLGFSILILSGTFQSITVYFLYTLFDQVEITVLKSLGKKKKERERLGDFPGGPMVMNPPANAGDMDLTPGLGRSRMPWGN